jgi:4-amino-4-deoxy-L-arabinose transferase-like glycosyltransferase
MRFSPRKPAWVDSNRFVLLTGGIILLASLFKIVLLALEVIPFNADEAIVGLMAKHILAGNWEVFFYGQAYMGSLDATFVAAGFSIFGENVFIIRAVQILLYAGTIGTAVYLAKSIYQDERIALSTGILLAIPTVNTTLYTTISLGGYGEALLIGNLLLIACLKAISGSTRRWLALWGFLSGLGVWAFGITLVFIVPTAIALIVHLWRSGWRWSQSLIAIGFGLLGASPLILWGLDHGAIPIFQELFGSAISGASSTNPWISILAHMRNLILFGSTVLFGMRPPWEIRWLGLPLLPFALAIWLVVLAISINRLQQRDYASLGRGLLWGVLLSLGLGFIFTPFGADPSGRYFLPLIVPLALFAAETVHRASRTRWVGPALLAGIVLYNIWGTMESANRMPPGLTTQFDSITWIDHRYDDELISFLTSHGELQGYTNYWVAYPLAFLSDEQIIFVPKLPYHPDLRYTARDNRYDPYNVEVDQSSKVAYITTHNPKLDGRLREVFAGADITWQESQVGDYHVFYGLSDILRPEEIEGMIYD